MINRTWLIRICLIVLTSSSFACVGFSGSEVSTEGEWQMWVDELHRLLAGLDMPDYLTAGEPKRGGEFDVNAYFTVLDHLALESGYVLDYVYYFDGMGGAPVLYVRPEAQPAFATYQDYLAAGGEDKDCLWCNYLDYVHTDDTPEGYFQLTLLRILGDQFYLDWHANYNDALPICDARAIEAILENLDGEFYQKMSARDYLRAQRLDVTPVVVLEETQVKVSLVIFTKWGGFIRESYTLSRTFPHTVLDFVEEVLLEYDCGVMF